MELTVRDQRYLREFKPVYPELLFLLEIFGNAEANAGESRGYLFSPDGYIHCTLDYDDNCEYLKEDLSKGQITIGCEELREILRLNHMIDRLDAILNQERFWKKNVPIEPYFMSHPQWLKIEKQALKILALLRKP